MNKTSLKILVITLTTFLQFTCVFAHANNSDVLSQCYITPELWDNTPPKIVFSQTNDLTKNIEDSVALPNGKIIVVEGRLLDSSCVPISGATIQLWQPNWLGVYQDDNTPLKKFDNNFTGSGTTITDNMGKFSFRTIMPGTTKSRAPHLNFHVKHKDFPEFETQIFFENQHKNKTDVMLKTYVNVRDYGLLTATLSANYLTDNDETSTPIYEIDLVLDRDNKFKGF